MNGVDYLDYYEYDFEVYPKKNLTKTTSIIDIMVLHSRLGLYLLILSQRRTSLQRSPL